MKNVSGPQVVTTTAASESPLPAEIQEALGELIGAAREGLLALSVGVGLRVVHELMEAEVTEIVGPKGKHDPERTATRHGHEDGSMTLGGRRVPVSRPRVRSADDQRELPVATYEYFAGRDPLQRAVMDRMLAGVSTRKFARVAEPVGEQVEQTRELDAQEHGVRDVHPEDSHRAGRADGPSARRCAPGGDDA
jgi:putative transposase